MTVPEIQSELRHLIAAIDEQARGSVLRASVMTHIAWVPAPWREAARATLAGLGEAHPSRTIILFPDPESPEAELEGKVELYCFPAAQEDRQVCTEVIWITLPGSRARAPSSVVTPLLRSDLPVFLRWRGALPFGDEALEQLVDLADRLIVDSREWDEPEHAYEQLPALFERVAVSDIAWARLDPWRDAIAALWPGVATAQRIRVRAPRAEALLLARWLAARLGRPVELEHEPAPEIEGIRVDDGEVLPGLPDTRSASDLLSDQLDRFGRDAVYEQAVRSP